MNGYSKMRVNTNFSAKSRSVDFSDLTFSSPPEEAHESPNPVPSKPHQGEPNGKNHGQMPCQEDGGQRFGVVLSRNFSTTSQRFRAGERSHGTSTLQDAVRRAFSMRKPSSVAEGYWRIYDTGFGDGDGGLVEEEEEVEQQQQQQQHQQVRSSRRKRGKILRACKRLFGF